MEKVVKTDLYDAKGILLLSKGQMITDEMLQRLKKIPSFESLEFEAKDVTELDTQKVTTCSNALKRAFNRIDDKLVEVPSNILNEIVFDSVMRRWSLFVKALSNYINWVYTHSINVSLISVMVAMMLGVKQELLADIALGGLLHDIGKLMVPKEIIQKAGKLTEEEFSCIKQHCELGCSMLNESGLSPVCMEIVLQHHERLDGSGYPHGLKGEQISQYAQIVIVADVLDAMTSYRPYKRSVGMNTAIAQLKREPEKYPSDILSLLESIL